jgi:murein DD-endopeptidase MepM/ murein hydrolase activator NlpD
VRKLILAAVVLVALAVAVLVPTVLSAPASGSGFPRPPSGPIGHSGLEPIACSGITLTQGYGPTSQVGEPIISGIRFHTGWDLACPAGTPIVSVTAGKAHVTLGYGGGFGNNVQVQMRDLWVRYAHLEAVLVSDGDQVAPGTVLGLEGSTGFSTGPHLHFEVDRGCAAVTCSIDPGELISLPVGG